jgi:hypothetical protein
VGPILQPVVGYEAPEGFSQSGSDNNVLGLGLTLSRDSEETISEFSLQGEEMIRRRCKHNFHKQKKAHWLEAPKFFQFAEAWRDGRGGPSRKGRKGKKGQRCVVAGKGVLLKDAAGKEVGGGADFGNNLNSAWHSTPASGIRLIMEESATWVPESPLANEEVSSRKVLDASRIFSLQRSGGFSFQVADKTIVSKLVELEDIEVEKEEAREQVVGDQ